MQSSVLAAGSLFHSLWIRESRNEDAPATEAGSRRPSASEAEFIGQVDEHTLKDIGLTRFLSDFA